MIKHRKNKTKLNNFRQESKNWSRNPKKFWKIIKNILLKNSLLKL